MSMSDNSKSSYIPVRDVAADEENPPKISTPKLDEPNLPTNLSDCHKQIILQHRRIRLLERTLINLQQSHEQQQQQQQQQYQQQSSHVQQPAICSQCQQPFHLQSNYQYAKTATPNVLDQSITGTHRDSIFENSIDNSLISPPFEVGRPTSGSIAGVTPTAGGGGADGSGSVSSSCCGPVGGLSVEEELKQPMYRAVFKRLPWLVVLLIVQSFSATIMTNFDNLINSNLLLSFFVPMLTGTGGNAGNQPSVMLTRALGIPGENKPIFKVFVKEMILAVIIGSILAVVTFARILAEYPAQMTAAIAISLALFATVLISVFAGVMFSIVIDGFKNCDPADGAAPLVTTICDLIGIALLCLIAGAMLPENGGSGSGGG